MNKLFRSVLALCYALALSAAAVAQNTDPLPSWNEGATKQSIIKFVVEVTTPGGAGFVAPADRVATFDNDGTLWVEHPFYTQLVFALDRIKTLAPEHPEWQEQQPFKAVLEGDLKAVLAGGDKALLALVMASHAGMSTADFEQIVTTWIASAKDPRWKRPYTDLVYQPMLEVLSYLRANGFRTFIVSGGGIEFMRPWTEKVYGIPPNQVVGSSIKTQWEWRDGDPALVRLPELNFNDDKDGKPVGINQHIGQRPIAAFGNSDGDLQMLQWATTGKRPGFALIVHHTDAVREYAYDKDTKVGHLEKALVAAKANGWTVASMKTDWKVIFGFEQSEGQ
jgi:phosphoglycolate phosphatase-like HAD superfamily hydrolase